jgi:hypothetical protein
VRELVDVVEHAILPPFTGAILDEVIGPDMVGLLGAQTETGSVRKPDATLLGLFGGDLQALAPPDPLDPLVIDDPAAVERNISAIFSVGGGLFGAHASIGAVFLAVSLNATSADRRGRRGDGGAFVSADCETCENSASFWCRRHSMGQ